MGRWLLFLIVSIFSGTAASAADTQIPDGKDAYLLKAGDVVEVSVWREDALKREAVVLPDGSITFPLAGRVEVAGLNITKASEKIAERLKNYISEPQVTVVIAGINGNRVYVIGKVLKPGPIILDTPMTVMQALSLAGGLDKFADEDSIKILRVTSSGQEALPVRYNDLMKARDLSTNRQLVAGDTVMVP